MFHMELEIYAQAVEDNYQHLADILLDSPSAASALERLLSIEWTPVPPMKRAYAIWSAGIWAEVLACFPTEAFPRLLHALKSTPDDRNLSRIYKALTMWGDRFALVLSDWLYASDDRLRGRAIQGVALYGELLNTFCDANGSSLDQQLHRDNYPELARMRRDWEIGVAPPTRLTGAPRLTLSESLARLLVDAADETQQIAILRGLRRLGSRPEASITNAPAAIVAVATAAASRTVEREAIIALCYVARDQAADYMAQYWRENEQKRQMAAEILGLARTETAFAMLRELLGDANADTRRKAIASMEAFETEEALDILEVLQEPDRKTHRQLLRSRNQIKRRLQRRRRTAGATRKQSAVYDISPLALLSQAPARAVFSERALSAAVDAALIADLASSRRYAVELGLFERRTDLYRLSGMGAAVHWVEAYVRDGLSRFASAADEGSPA